MTDWPRRLRRVAVALGALVVLLLVAGWWALRITTMPEPDLPGTVRQASLEWESRQRTYRYYRPRSPAPSPPIVFVLHGSMGDGEQIRGMTGYEFDRLADRYGFLAVYPDGFERHWNGCRKQGPYAANELDVDDVGFLRAIATELEKREGADPARVFATGFSNGGHMAIRLALEAPDFVRAVAPIAASLPTDENLGCTPSDAAVPILLINGTEDPMNPYGGGTVALYGVWGNRGTVRSSLDTARVFARNAGYTRDPEVIPLPDRRRDDGSFILHHRWVAPEMPEVGLYAVVGGGHTIPHPVARLPRLLGRTNADVDAADEIWAFFARASAAPNPPPGAAPGGPERHSRANGDAGVGRADPP